jgi:hypothetical protein
LHLRLAREQLRSMRARTALLASLLAAFTGCACDTVPSDAIEECSATQVVPGAVTTDILFVIDDSGSMSEEQTTLRAGLAAFIQALDASPIANDFQIGVTTTSVVDFDTADDGVSGGDLVAPGIMRASDANLVSDFQAAVLVGTGGPGREQPFTAARRAIEKSVAGGANEGFLRPGAELAVIFLSDEDDCSGAAALANNTACRTQRTASPSSLVPVGEFASFLSGPLAGETREVVVAAIVGVAPGSLDLVCVMAGVCDPGNPTVTCPTCCDTALDPGHRFVELLGALGPASTRLASICDPSFDQALSDFATAILGQSLPLDGAPADWRMLVARVERPGVGTLPCEIAPDDADPATRNAADAIYEPPRAGRPASLTFQNGCALEQGDRVDVDVVCAG